MQTFDKYAPALLDAIDEQTAIFRATRRDADNPRWLIATPVTWNGDAPTVQLHSSQSWEKGGGIVVGIAREHGNAWDRDGMQYFRALKHAYLDALGISGGMPRAHRLRTADNTVGDVSADVAALIAARTAPPPPPPPKAPKAKKRTPRTASAKDGALADRIIDQLDPERMMPGPPITSAAAGTLRRAQLTLHRWAELECGTHAGHIEREGGEDTGRPIFYPAGRHVGGRWVDPKPYAVPDRERGALARVAAVCKASGLHFYHQTDPRGCALYVAAEPLTAENYSQRGIPCL